MVKKYKTKITREQIIAATATVINKVGLENATIDLVVKEAKIAKGSIYSFFACKEDLLNDSVRYIAEKKIEYIEELVSKYKTPIDKLAVLVKAHNNFGKDNPESLLMNYALLISSHKNIRTYSATVYFSVYIKMITNLVKKILPKDSHISPKSVALIIVLLPDFRNIIDIIDPTILNDIKSESDVMEIILKIKF